MSKIISKLRLDKHSPVLILNAAPEFNEPMSFLESFSEVHTIARSGITYPVALVFVQNENEIKKFGLPVLTKLAEDALLWMAYPKKSSKKYKATISRDNGWQQFGEKGFEGVAMVSIDDDWSALRLRHANHIKSMTRSTSFAMSAAGKSKTTNRAHPTKHK